MKINGQERDINVNKLLLRNIANSYHEVIIGFSDGCELKFSQTEILGLMEAITKLIEISKKGTDL